MVADLVAEREPAAAEQDCQATAERSEAECQAERAREAARDMEVRAERTARAAGPAERVARAVRAMVDTDR